MVSNIDIHYTYLRDFPGGSENDESACRGGDPRFNP